MGSTLAWLLPALGAFFHYGVGQGLVKKYADSVPPARFCFFLVLAKSVVNLGFFAVEGSAVPLGDPASLPFLAVGFLAYFLDGAAWVLYFESVVCGPITIVGTLSAAYPAFTVLFARLFLAEALLPWQYVGVALLVLGCVGLSYSPADPSAGTQSRRWIPLAATALVLWGGAQTLVKYAYGLPHADEAGLAVLNTLGGMASLGLYGWFKTPRHGLFKRFAASFVPMALMAVGDLLVIVASRRGPISLVTPISGAYPLVTVGFAYVFLNERLNALQWLCVLSVLAGMTLGSSS